MRNSVQISEEILSLLKKIPEIKTFNIEIFNFTIFLESINESKLLISYNVEYCKKNDNSRYYSNLIEAGVKHSSAIELSELILKLYKDNGYVIDMNPINLGLTSLRLRYNSETEE